MSASEKQFFTAIIDETSCIGCARCLPACPVDAIVGSSQQLHTVINTECIACGLCLPPCPVDCIRLEPVANPLFSKEKTKQRAQARKKRLKIKQQQTQLHQTIPSLTARQIEIKNLLKTHVSSREFDIRNKN